MFHYKNKNNNIGGKQKLNYSQKYYMDMEF